jgi:tripartite-type tricarboxylate transporter receptor subunit TctC
MRRALWTTAVAIALAVTDTGVLAQAFPGKTVRLVIPFAVGGSSDSIARIIGPYLTERWKQQVLVDPHPGAATVIGTDFAAKSAPDGHTLLINSTQFVQSPATFAKLPYDPYTDIVPITRIIVSPLAITAHTSLPAKNIREAGRACASPPRRAQYRHRRERSDHLPLYDARHVTIVPVPYKGAGPLVIDASGGHVPLAIGAVSSLQGARTHRARAHAWRDVALGGVSRRTPHLERRSGLRRRHLVRPLRSAAHANRTW